MNSMESANSSTNSLFHFPSPREIKIYLCNHPLLNVDKYEKNKIATAISYIAVEYLSDRDLSEMDFKMCTRIIIKDLKNGCDVTGEPTLFGKIDLPQEVWTQIEMDAEKALIDCANNFNSKN